MGNDSEGKVLAVDWGAKRIGLAVSDETRMLARSLTVIQHTSRVEDARRIIEIGKEVGATSLIIGVTYSDGNELSPSGRSSQRLAAEIEKQSDFRVVLWDEAFTTTDAQESLILTGTPRSKRVGHVDDKAAALLLQNYLDLQEK